MNKQLIANKGVNPAKAEHEAKIHSEKNKHNSHNDAGNKNAHKANLSNNLHKCKVLNQPKWYCGIVEDDPCDFNR